MAGRVGGREGRRTSTELKTLRLLAEALGEKMSTLKPERLSLVRAGGRERGRERGREGAKNVRYSRVYVTT